jgi:hemoglobin-like flavoprotein
MIRDYPDNSEIHAQKARGRRQRAVMTFAEKLDALDALKARVEPIVRARQARAKEKPNTA